MLIEGRLTRAELTCGAVVAIIFACAASLALVAGQGVPVIPTLPFLASLAVVAVGYTLPPLKLCYRTLGELDVAYTHGLAVLVCGWIFMGGAPTESLPWLIGVPIALATLPSITLSNVPDREADAAVRKWTVAARFGQRRAIDLALAATLTSSAAAVVWPALAAVPDAYRFVPWGAVPHAVVLALLLHRARSEVGVPRRMTSLMLASLSFVLWFIVPPLVGLAA